MSQPLIGLEGALNFRDIGGYRAADGGRIRIGRLFRSDSPARFTDADLARIAPLNIGLIYDLRATDEREREPKRWPAGHSVETVNGLDSEALAAVRYSGWRQRLIEPGFNTDLAYSWIVRTYGEMPTLFAGLVSSLFDRLSAPSAPVTMINCTAGKDRTGFVIAMLLFGLGVSRADVLENYLLSRQLRSPEKLLPILLGEYADRVSAQGREAALTIADVREDYLNAALDSIERDFGTVEHYLARACGLSAEKRERFRAQHIA